MTGDLRGLSRPQLRILFDSGTTTGLTDGQLLERFSTRRDEGAEIAFAALVQRHGPMVLGACRGILRDDHEAMDVFQATFLVLARKGGSLWVRDSLGPWLHRVACHAASRSKSQAARRRAVERRAAEMAVRRNYREDRDDLASALHEELNRLPERYRAVVVLCDLEGRTCEDAARHLGCPVGTVGSRLARGRQRLRERLSRRGFAPRAGASAVAVEWQQATEPIPVDLADATADAASRFVSIRAVSEGVAASLALEVLRSMTIMRCGRLASMLIVLGISTSGVVSVVASVPVAANAQPGDAPAVARGDGLAVTKVEPGKLRAVVEERGSVETSRTARAYCLVEGQSTIISLLPEGTPVAKGQLVCELDSAALKDQLTNQEITTKSAEAAHQNARLTREIAEITFQEYVNGIYPNDHGAAMGNIASAKASIANAEERLKRSRSAQERLNTLLAGQGGTKTPADVLATLDVQDRIADAERALERGRSALERGQSKRQVLERFTKAKIVKQLQIDVDKARQLELVRLASSKLERTKEAKLQRQIENCRILASADGPIVYANDPIVAGVRTRTNIEEGATVRERQLIFSIPDLKGPVRVAVKIPEAIVDQISARMESRIQVDAFPNEAFAGVVEYVAPLPDPEAVFGKGVRVYTAHVTITKPIPGLRPGMTAQVEILVGTRENALSVPVQAVVWYDKKPHVALERAQGPIEWRDVTLGLSDGKVVEVKEGLKAGETVALEPVTLLSPEQRLKVSQAGPAPKIGKASGPRGKGSVELDETLRSIRDKLRAMTPEDRAKLRDARPEDRSALLRKAGLTDDEIRRYHDLRQRTGGAR